MSCDETTAVLDASTTAALVAVVGDYRAATAAGLLAVGHDRTACGAGATAPPTGRTSGRPRTGGTARTGACVRADGHRRPPGATPLSGR